MLKQQEPAFEKVFWGRGRFCRFGDPLGLHFGWWIAC